MVLHVISLRKTTAQAILMMGVPKRQGAAASESVQDIPDTPTRWGDGRRLRPPPKPTP